MDDMLAIIDESVFNQGPPELKNEIYSLLAMQLPSAKNIINTAYEQKNLKILEDELHKLIGTSVYCGLLRLKLSVTQLHSAVKQSVLPEYEHLERFNKDITDVLNDLYSKGVKV